MWATGKTRLKEKYLSSYARLIDSRPAALERAGDDQ
jgi:hypothetical protein